MDIHFAAPQWVHLLWAVLAVTVALLWLDRRGTNAFERFMNSRRHGALIVATTPFQRVMRTLFLGLAGVALTLALMRPQWGLEFVSTPRIGGQVMICLDVSRSMLAEDVTPNRLERAKAEIRDLLSYLDGDQVGLIAFAGRATVVSPLTPDFGFLRLALDEAGPHSVSRGGTRLEEPIRRAIDGFGETGETSRTILLITDGEDHDSFPLEAAADALARGIRILSVGFGDENGSEIVITDRKTGARETLRDADGKIIKSRLDGDLLREIALVTEGAYIPAGTGVLDLESIYERHIATLTRGDLDVRGRAVRNDGYQWAILLGLVFLLISVTSTRSRRRASATLAVFALASAISLAPSHDVWAQTTPAPSATTNVGTPAPVAEESAKAEEERPEPPVPEDPRDAYNQGLAHLDAASLDEAERLLTASRDNARLDTEVRFRATFNLGWVAIERANAALENEPKTALSALQSAAGWFQDAIALRPNDTDARHNLELTLQRANALADALRETSDTTFLQEVEGLIEVQRNFLEELKTAITPQNSATREASRERFAALSARQLEHLSQAQGLAERAGRTVEQLKGKPPEELQPEERLERVQLDGLLHYLHRARQRLGQARTRIRRMDAESAYRRASNGLAELKRARDQFLDPVKRIDVLMGDQIEITRLTAMNAAEVGLDESAQTPPAWLTKEHLTEQQTSLAERTSELLQGFQQASEQAPETTPTPDPENAKLLATLTEATPFLREAATEMARAQTDLEVNESLDALRSQNKALEQLASAREVFLDIKGLAQLIYEQQTPVAGTLRQITQKADDGWTEIVPALLERQMVNSERLIRLGTLISDELVETLPSPAPTPSGADEAPPAGGNPARQQQLELAYELRLTAQKAMDQAESSLKDIEAAGPSLASSHPIVATAAQQQDAAIAAIEAIRRVFFDLLEHLRDTAERQRDLNDKTEAVTALAGTASPEETLAGLGPLQPPQASLAEMAGQIATGLSDGANAPTPEGTDAQAAAQQKQAMSDAAALVAEAKTAMESASQTMTAAPPVATQIRTPQDNALAKLDEAIARLSPPPPPGEGEQPQDQQEPQPNEESSEEEPNPSPSSGQEQPQEQPLNERQMAELLQAVRDREAERRADQANRERLDYQPVEKDW